MAPHVEDVVAAPLQCFSPSPVRKTLTLSSIGSQILSSNFKYLKTVDGFIKLIHVVLCLYCGVSMLNSCHPTAMNNQMLPAHLSCTSRQINFILTHLSAFVLHSVILLSYLLSPLSSVLLPSTILALGITTSLLCMACILRNYISLRRNINYDLLLKPMA